MALSPEETRRYARHLVLKGFGGAGQQTLKAAKVLVVGAGGLGSPAIAYLAATGVGTLGIADDDTVALSNLQRQVLHRSDGLGEGKAESAGRFVAGLNPHVEVVIHAEHVGLDNAGALVAGYDVVLDGTDNLATRRAVAAACEAARVPLVSGAVSMFDGQVSVLAPHLARADGRPAPRFDDLYPAAADDADMPSCEVTGVLGPLTGVVGTLMAMEAVKLVAGLGEPLIGRLLLYDARAARFTEVEL